MTNQQSIDKLLSLSLWLEKDSELYQAIVMAINALQAQEWIPCKERLPEKIEKNYWVCTDDHGWQGVCKWRKYPSKRGDFWAWHLNAHVVAWKSLSESYKEDVK